MTSTQITSYSTAKAERTFFKIRKKTRLPTLSTFIPHSIGSSNHNNQTRREILIGKDEWKLTVCRQDDTMYRKL